jgi:peptidoglycan hydrolase-like protein with peptidoglycan-binding domain
VWSSDDSGLLHTIPLIRTEPFNRQAEPAETVPPAHHAGPSEALPPLTNGVGRPLASGEIGTVLSILFKDVPADSATDAPRLAPAPAAPAQPEAKPPLRNVLEAEHGRAVQARLAQLGFLDGDPAAAWSASSRQALREFKAAHGLASDDVWDEGTERVLFGPNAVGTTRFVGVWAPDPNACSPKTNRRGLLPAVINHQGAWAGDVSCAFKNGRRDGESWRFAATCTGARKRWTANVRLAVSGDTLVWSSERGSQTYVRCPSGLG